jgi:hypothetical protein
MQGSAELPEAFAVLGFAFYVQPMLMPLLHEMPPGRAGVRVMSLASCWVVGGVASLVRAPLSYLPGACFLGCLHAAQWWQNSLLLDMAKILPKSPTSSSSKSHWLSGTAHRPKSVSLCVRTLQCRRHFLPDMYASGINQR